MSRVSLNLGLHKEYNNVDLWSATMSRLLELQWPECFSRYYYLWKMVIWDILKKSI